MYKVLSDLVNISYLENADGTIVAEELNPVVSDLLKELRKCKTDGLTNDDVISQYV